MNALRHGVFTSEFWACIAAVAVAESQALTSNPKLNLGGMAVAAVYALGRSLVKHGAAAQGGVAK